MNIVCKIDDHHVITIHHYSHRALRATADAIFGPSPTPTPILPKTSSAAAPVQFVKLGGLRS